MLRAEDREMPDSLQGHLIVAAPKLRDPNFFKAVVLLVQHNDEGALGLILNRPLGATIEAAWEQVTDTPRLVSGLLHHAGWGPGQPEAEIEHASWLSAPAAREQVFGPTESLWDALMKLIARSAAM